ncbi:uncharacterized protein LOC126369374 isoform X3 [Pectinophora gossypiella]|uniref:uncharacterized protein LOC126369374 isoform X3 n=1 Tax=Pectinophora gossypiella TaxID=13191 RepID=UPI00214E47DE|nr:uncharacterized protein LOC126369374 isoform X3 [Pectinophora gossypiella]
MKVLLKVSRTIKTQVWWTVTVAIMVMMVVEVTSLSGPNVCMVKQKYNITKRVKYRAPMSVRTYEWCFAVPPRCSRWNTEMRDVTRLETEERTAEMAVCCPGYKLKDVSCVPICPNGKSGQGCSEDCPPNKWGPNCVHECKACDHGSCDPRTGECRCQDGWQGESCETSMATTAVIAMMEQLLTTAKSTTSTKPTTQATPTITARSSTIATTITSTVPSTTASVLSTTEKNITTSAPATTKKLEVITNIEYTLTQKSTMISNSSILSTLPTSINTYNFIPEEATKIKNETYNRTEWPIKTTKLTPTIRPHLATQSSTVINTTELSTIPTTIKPSTAVFTTPIPRITTVPTTVKERTRITVKVETSKKPEPTIKQPTTTKFKPKEIWIKPAQKEPEHITAVMGDKGTDRSTIDLISVISIAGGVMMAVITVAVVIVMLERCKRPRYEDVRKYNDIRMQVMMDNNDIPPPYVRSIFHTPLPDPPTTDKCHYQPISTLDRNLKQFMRPVVVQTISPLMLENFRGILECHYDHLPRRSQDMGSMPTRCSIAPSHDERAELLPTRAHSLTDSDIEAMKCEAKLDVIDNTTSEPLYAEIPCWRPPSARAIEVVNLNGEAVTEL